MPVDYAAATEVSSKSANRVKLTRLTLMLGRGAPEQQQARFNFQAVTVEMIDDPKYVAPDIPQIDDGKGGLMDDPTFSLPPVPQIEKITPVDSKTITKSVAEVAADHPVEFQAAYDAIKKVAYAYMGSEGVFPAGTIT